MSEKFQLKGCISEVKFGYHSRMSGYTTLTSDIPKLYSQAGPLCMPLHDRAYLFKRT